MKLFRWLRRQKKGEVGIPTIFITAILAIIVMAFLPAISTAARGGNWTINSALVFLGDNGYTAYSQPTGDFYTNTVLPNAPSTYDIGASGNEYANGYFDSINDTYPEIVILKSADETVNNSAVLQNDDELLFAVGANEVWAFDLVAVINSGAVPDFKFGVTVPAGGDCFLTGVLKDAGNAVFVPGYAVSQGSAAITMRGIGVDFTYMAIKGLVINGATAGNLQVQWAQNTQDASDTKVLENSYIIAKRLA